MGGRRVACGVGIAVAVSAMVAAAASSSGTVGGGSPEVTQLDPEVWSAQTDTAGVRARVANTTSISGRVLNQAGVGVRGYRVEAFDSSGNFMSDAITGPRGGYAMQKMQLGPYRLKVSPVRQLSAPCAPVWSGDAVVFTQARVVTLTRAPARLDFRVRPSASIVGTVTSRRAPAANAMVRRCGGSFLDCEQTRTDAKGRYTFTGVPAQAQRFVLFDRSKDSWVPLASRTTPPKIVAGRSVRIDLTVPTVLPGKMVKR